MGTTVHEGVTLTNRCHIRDEWMPPARWDALGIRVTGDGHPDLNLKIGIAGGRDEGSLSEGDKGNDGEGKMQL